MFRPNIACKIYVASGKNDVYGQPLPAEVRNERCSVVKLVTMSEKTSVRVDSSASRGTAREFQTEAVILLQSNTAANIDDVIEVANTTMRITSKFPRIDILGKLDHYQVEAVLWNGKKPQ